MSEHPPMLARGIGGAHSGSRPAKPAARLRSPDAAAKAVRDLLGEGEYLAARDLARDAVQRFPEDADLLQLVDFFEPRGKARVLPNGPRQPDRSKEFEWMRHPPEWAHGKWVALLREDVLAADESLAAVTKILDGMDLPSPPLVHYVE